MKNKIEKLLPSLSLITLLAAIPYGLILPFCWGNNPLLENGTLSLLCEDRQLYFWIWGILTSGSIVLNIWYLYKRYEYKNRFFDGLLISAFVSMIAVSLTLGHSIEDWNPKRILHWVATGVFVVLTVAPLLLFFLSGIKKRNNSLLFAIITTLILMTFLGIFIFVGKSGLMEILPIALIEIFLLVLNFTPVFKIK